MILLQLFWSFLQIGLFSFGGGYAAMPLIQAQIVTQHGWLGMAEFTDLVTISQMTPGPIAINAATFVGLRVAGVSGALVGCFVIGILNNGMSMMGISADWQQTVKGLVILAAVAFDLVPKRKKK